jgi:hypothetical protein
MIRTQFYSLEMQKFEWFNYLPGDGGGGDDVG